MFPVGLIRFVPLVRHPMSADVVREHVEIYEELH